MTRLLSSLLSALMIATLTGCGNKSLVVKADDYDGETIVDLMNETEAVIKTRPGGRPIKPSKKAQIVNTPINGEWTIVAVGNHAIVRDEDVPYVIFSDVEGRFYASNGCNIINGDYEYANDGTLKFSDVVSSRKDCQHVPYATDISVVLNNGVQLKTRIEDKNRESYLDLYTMTNDLLMTLRRHNVEVLNGQWDVVKIGDTDIDDPEVNLFLDIPEHSIHGNTGCNYFNGIIFIDPTQSASISFSHMGVTMRLCHNSDIERQYLVALEETTTYSLKDANTLYFNDSSNHPVLMLKRQK